jgi:uncharacterized protein YbjT (DUF2867 family)
LSDLSYISVKTEIKEGRVMNVLVLGGRGFIGRHVALALRRQGEGVRISSRHEGRDRAQIRLEAMGRPDDWLPALEGIDAVVNCVGILRERAGESYEAVHRHGPAALANACARVGVRLVHVSALGLAGARHGFMTSKMRGEDAILAAGGDAVIVRPSLLDGVGGYGAVWIRAFARLPVHAVPAQAAGRIAPLDVMDLGLAIAALCRAAAGSFGPVVELGGPDEWTFDAYLAALRGRKPAQVIRIPAACARAAAWLCDLLHVSPYSVGHLELLTRDNAPASNELARWLGRAPTVIGPPRPAGSPAAEPLRA